MSTEGKDGYEFGDQFAWDVTARYGVLTYFNLGLGLNGISSTQDKDHKGVFARPMMSMLDTPAYSGLHSYLATLALQVKIPNTAGSAEIKVQLPVYQSVGGYQQVLENRLLASTTWVF